MLRFDRPHLKEKVRQMCRLFMGISCKGVLSTKPGRVREKLAPYFKNKEIWPLLARYGF